MNNIDTIRTTFKDYCRPNHFSASFITPFGASTDSEIANLSLIGGSFPSYTIGEIPMSWMGYRIPIPGDMAFSDIRLTFNHDIEFKTRDIFDNWMKTIRNYKDNTIRPLVRSSNNPIPAVVDGELTIYQLNGKLERVKKCTCFNAYPHIIDEIDLNMDSENMIQTFSVTFVYTHFEIGKV